MGFGCYRLYRFDRASEAAVEDDRSIVDDALLFLMFEVKEEAAAGGREGESKKHNGLI